MIKLSPSLWSCYDSRLKYKNTPDDLVDITHGEHRAFMGDVPDGKRLVKNVYPFVFEDIPPPSIEELFNGEMEALNVAYDKAMTNLSIGYNIAVARDGSTETEKVTAIRGKITALDGKYETDQLEIINKYYGA